MATAIRSDPGSLDPELASLFAEFERRAVASGRRFKLREWMDLAETWRIVAALRQCGGNRSAAARALGIGRRTLYTKMEKLRIEPSWGNGHDVAPAIRAAGPL